MTDSELKFFEEDYINLLGDTIGGMQKALEDFKVKSSLPDTHKAVKDRQLIINKLKACYHSFNWMDFDNISVRRKVRKFTETKEFGIINEINKESDEISKRRKIEI